MPYRFLLLLSICLGLLPSNGILAQESTLPDRVLTVGTKEAVPFSFRDEGGEWVGLSVDLWRSIAEALELEFEFQEESLEGLISGLAEGRLDISVAALTVTPEREQAIDFTHPFYPSGLGIAIPRRGSPALRAMGRLLSSGFLKAIGTLAILIFLAGAALWVFERKRNPEQFGGPPTQGLGEAFWWSAVTMTTVGYGDKAPMTLGGRMVALIWMFASIITISGLTAAIASTLTLSSLEGDVRGPNDLQGSGLVLCAKGSTGQAWLRNEGISARGYNTVGEALEALRKGVGSAVVYDAPILRYLTQDDPDLTMAPGTFERQDYAIGMPLDSPLRKPVNGELLKQLRSEEWESLMIEYLGVTP